VLARIYALAAINPYSDALYGQAVALDAQVRRIHERMRAMTSERAVASHPPLQLQHLPETAILQREIPDEDLVLERVFFSEHAVVAGGMRGVVTVKPPVVVMKYQGDGEWASPDGYVVAKRNSPSSILVDNLLNQGERMPLVVDEQGLYIAKTIMSGTVLKDSWAFPDCLLRLVDQEDPNLSRDYPWMSCIEMWSGLPHILFGGYPAEIFQPIWLNPSTVGTRFRLTSAMEGPLLPPDSCTSDFSQIFGTHIPEVQRFGETWRLATIKAGWMWARADATHIGKEPVEWYSITLDKSAIERLTRPGLMSREQLRFFAEWLSHFPYGHGNLVEAPERNVGSVIQQLNAIFGDPPVDPGYLLPRQIAESTFLGPRAVQTPDGPRAVVHQPCEALANAFTIHGKTETKRGRLAKLVRDACEGRNQGLPAYQTHQYSTECLIGNELIVDAPLGSHAVTVSGYTEDGTPRQFTAFARGIPGVTLMPPGCEIVEPLVTWRSPILVDPTDENWTKDVFNLALAELERGTFPGAWFIAGSDSIVALVCDKGELQWCVSDRANTSTLLRENGLAPFRHRQTHEYRRGLQLQHQLGLPLRTSMEMFLDLLAPGWT
jgi:hypothetical protein